MDTIFIYVTCANKEEAQKIAKSLLEAHLVACANIMPAHEAHYWWEGKLEQAGEVAVIFKTQPKLFNHVEAAIKDMHSYDCPCIVALPIEMGHEPYLQWVKDETTK